MFLIVDNLFGSDGRYHVRVEGRDFTPTEQRIIRRLLDVVFTECQKAWEPVHPIEFVYLRSEMNTQFANIATPTEVVVAMTFHIELGAGGAISTSVCRTPWWNRSATCCPAPCRRPHRGG